MSTIVLLQYVPQERSISGNLDHVLRQLKDIHDSLVILPEFFLSSYSSDNFEHMNLTTLYKTLKPLIKACTEQNIGIVSSVPVISRGIKRNRGIFINSSGITYKDKSELFGHEKKTMKSGTRNPIFQFGDISFGIQICLDIRNPVPAHKQSKRGMKLLINPATVSVDYLRTIGKARSLENNIHVVFCNRSGSEKDGIQYLGKSGVFFPDGKEKTITKKEARLSFTM